MKLENQVCSLELAKKLKELGVKQDGIYSYYQFNERNVYLRETSELHCANPMLNKENWICSAFTVAELGEMLPPPVFSYKVQNSPSNEYWKCNRDFGWSPCKEAGREADARAKMLIYLLEEKK